MSIHTSSQETINTLEAIFEKHKEERVCVIGTTCCGKSTLLKKIPNCVDMDEALWPLLTKEESDFVCQKPWTKEIGDFFDKLIYEKVRITKGMPMFGTVILDCDAVVYLDIADDLLEAHCKKRNADFTDAKNMKASIENDWNNHRLTGKQKFYYVTITE